jgi:hypothetical protein
MRLKIIKAGKYEPYTSAYATGEISNETNPEKRRKMESLTKEYGIRLLAETGDVGRLAALYIQEKAIPSAYELDAAHIAIATVRLRLYCKP